MQGSERRGFRSPLDRPTRFEAEEIHRRESVGESGSRGVFSSTFETQFRELRGRLHEMKQSITHSIEKQRHSSAKRHSIAGESYVNDVTIDLPYSPSEKSGCGSGGGDAIYKAVGLRSKSHSQDVSGEETAIAMREHESRRTESRMSSIEARRKIERLKRTLAGEVG